MTAQIRSLEKALADVPAGATKMDSTMRWWKQEENPPNDGGLITWVKTHGVGPEEFAFFDRALGSALERPTIIHHAWQWQLPEPASGAYTPQVIRILEEQPGVRESLLPTLVQGGAPLETLHLIVEARCSNPRFHAIRGETILRLGAYLERIKYPFQVWLAGSTRQGITGQRTLLLKLRQEYPGVFRTPVAELMLKDPNVMSLWLRRFIPGHLEQVDQESIIAAVQGNVGADGKVLVLSTPAEGHSYGFDDEPEALKQLNERLEALGIYLPDFWSLCPPAGPCPRS